MPFTEQELQNYQFYLNLVEERNTRYEEFYEQALAQSTSDTRNHLVVSGSTTLYSFEDIDDERRAEAPFGRVGRDDENHYVIKKNRFPVYLKNEIFERTIDSEINSLIPLAPSLPTVRLHKAPNDNVIEPKTKDGVVFKLLTPSRNNYQGVPRTNGYTIDLVNGDIVGYPQWNLNDGNGLDLWYIEENRKRRFFSIKDFASYIGSKISRYFEREIIIVEEGDLDIVLNGKPMQFNVR